MRSPLGRIRGDKKQSKSKQLEESDLPRLHHELMKEYGWIPIKEFRKLPLPTFWGLWSCILEDRQRQQDEYDKSKKRK